MRTENFEHDTCLHASMTNLEKGLPAYLQRSLDAMKESWKIEDGGGTDPHWDCWWCELNADINSAEVDYLISHEQAAYLRRKYLRMGAPSVPLYE